MSEENVRAERKEIQMTEGFVEKDNTVHMPAKALHDHLFFDRPGALLSWGLRNGDFAPRDIAQKLSQHGFKWIAQEVSDPETLPTGQQVIDLRQACHDLGLYFGIWEVAPTTLDNLVNYHPNFWLLNVEGPGDYAQLLSDARRSHPLLPMGIVTNGDPRIDWDVFLMHNIRALPEAYCAYNGSNETAPPNNMIDLMKGFGYTYVFPCVGVHSMRLRDYGNYPWDSHDGYSIFSVEKMTDDDWDVARIWNT